jgi:hypothetical protein
VSTCENRTDWGSLRAEQSDSTVVRTNWPVGILSVVSVRLNNFSKFKFSREGADDQHANHAVGYRDYSQCHKSVMRGCWGRASRLSVCQPDCRSGCTGWVATAFAYATALNYPCPDLLAKSNLNRTHPTRHPFPLDNYCTVFDPFGRVKPSAATFHHPHGAFPSPFLFSSICTTAHETGRGKDQNRSTKSGDFCRGHITTGVIHFS